MATLELFSLPRPSLDDVLRPLSPIGSFFDDILSEYASSSSSHFSNESEPALRLTHRPKEPSVSSVLSGESTRSVASTTATSIMSSDPSPSKPAKLSLERLHAILQEHEPVSLAPPQLKRRPHVHSRRPSAASTPNISSTQLPTTDPTPETRPSIDLSPEPRRKAIRPLPTPPGFDSPYYAYDPTTRTVIVPIWDQEYGPSNAKVQNRDRSSSLPIINTSFTTPDFADFPSPDPRSGLPSAFSMGSDEGRIDWSRVQSLMGCALSPDPTATFGPLPPHLARQMSIQSNGTWIQVDYPLSEDGHPPPSFKFSRGTLPSRLQPRHAPFKWTSFFIARP